MKKNINLRGNITSNLSINKMGWGKNEGCGWFQESGKAPGYS